MNARAHPDVDSEGAAEVKAITDAMVRLLIGVPLYSDGKLTIVSLAAEAGLRRNKLTHKHTGLKDLFYALVKARDPLPELEPRPRRPTRPRTKRTWPESAPNATACALSCNSWPGSSKSWRSRTTSSKTSTGT
ncbi:hypothetical protein ACFWNT_39260 [Streptomyces sp. NPDC058409]|uniref:hypothetical protein n=1 Tax=Streptomyces sp. NPDC058409 TaxID=3346484 RepID=UPI00365E3F6A